jgi:hypothetical protein
MTRIQIRVFLYDGPDARQTLTITGPNAEPPEELVVDGPRAATIYYLHDLDEHRNGYVYRTAGPE